MREIKFRAWNNFEEHELIGEGEMVTEENRGLTNYQILERFSNVMQYTGLKDKNGKEIYEGDIMRSACGKGVSFVIYLHDHFRFNSWMPKSMSLYTHSIGGEVIGNIHENPELLEVKTEA